MADAERPTEERILVCVSPRSSSARLLNSARRMATGLRAKWFAVYVEQPRMAMMPEAARRQAASNLRLASDLGAETATLPGRNVAGEVGAFARQRNVTRIIVGKPARSRGVRILSRSPVDQLVRMSGEADVYVIAGEPGEQREEAYVIRPRGAPLADYGAGILYLVLATLACFAMYPYFDLSNLIMVYLLGVTVTATGCGRGPAILSSILSMLAFDFFFVPPRFTFTVNDAQYVVTFAVMCVVGFVISHLAAGMRQQAILARLQERQAEAMHGLSRQLANTRGIEQVVQVAVRYVSEIFDGDVLALLPDEKHKLHAAAGEMSVVMQTDVVKQMAVARSAYDSGRMAGWGTRSSPTTEVLYVPLRAGDSSTGVLALRPRDPERFLLREQLALLESLAKQVALALEVELMSLRARPGQEHIA
jgi:two-component system sensor histidine kinase KdpD